MRIYKSSGYTENDTMCTGTVYKFQDRWFFRYILMFDDEYTDIPVCESSIPNSKHMTDFYATGVRVSARIVTREKEDGTKYEEAIITE